MKEETKDGMCDALHRRVGLPGSGASSPEPSCCFASSLLSKLGPPLLVRGPWEELRVWPGLHSAPQRRSATCALTALSHSSRTSSVKLKLNRGRCYLTLLVTPDLAGGDGKSLAGLLSSAGQFAMSS